jgi:hypothetical protein
MAFAKFACSQVAAQTEWNAPFVDTVRGDLLA